MTQKPGRRIVSKNKYIQTSILKWLAIAGLVASTYLLLFVLSTLTRRLPTAPLTHSQGIRFVLLPVSLFVLFLLLCSMIASVVAKVSKIDPGIPLTRANSGDLPPPDSLVRSSEEPPQA